MSETIYRIQLDLEQHEKKGLNKYGHTVDTNPLTHKQWLQHAYEECLDQAVHLRRAIADIPE